MAVTARAGQRALASMAASTTARSDRVTSLQAPAERDLQEERPLQAIDAVALMPVRIEAEVGEQIRIAEVHGGVRPRSEAVETAQAELARGVLNSTIARTA